MDASLDDILARFPTYGSSCKGGFRIAAADPAAVYRLLVRACRQRVASTPPRRSFASREFIGAGWEWAVFRDRGSVVKVPAERFAECGDPRYLANTVRNYDLIRQYVDPAFIAQTEFSESPPNIRQPWLQPLAGPIPYADSRTGLWRAFFAQLGDLLTATDWCPELNIRLGSTAFEPRNLRLDDHGSPKIIDFTSYIDLYRLYEERMRQEIAKTNQGLRWMQQALVRSYSSTRL